MPILPRPPESMRMAASHTHAAAPLGGLDTRALGWSLAALAALAMIPIFLVSIPALVDLPNHLARIYILANIDRNDALSANYQAAWSLRSYLLPDLLLIGLAKVLSIYMVGKLYAAATIAALAASTFWLSRVVHGRFNALAVFSLLFVYCLPFAWGFLNFLLGLSLAFWILGLWIRCDGQPNVRNLAFIILLGVATYLTHALALVVLALLIGGYQLEMVWEKRRKGWPDLLRLILFAAMPFIVPAVLVFGFGIGDELASGATVYGTWAGKFRALLSPSRLYGQPIDFYIWVFLLLFLFVGIRSKSVRLAPAIRGPLIALSIAAFLTPERLMGAWGVDFRLPPAVVILALSGLSLRKIPRVAWLSMTTVFLVLFTVRLVTLSDFWRAQDQRFEEFRAGLAPVERGARLLVVEAKPTPLYWHLSALAAIDRSAFIPTLFTGLTVLRPSAATRAIDTPSGHPISPGELIAETYEREARDSFHPIYWKDWRDHFDYVIWFGDDTESRDLFDRSQRVERGSFFTIYKTAPIAAGDHAK